MSVNENLVQRYQQLKTQETNIVREQAQAEARLQEAERQRTEVLSQLQTQFNVTTLEEAQQLLTSMEAELATSLTAGEQILAQLQQLQGE